MLFCELEFFAFFLPIVFAIHFLLGRFLSYKHSVLILVLASLIFYAWWKIEYTAILILSVLINWLLSSVISKNKSKSLLFFTIVLNILPLFFYKYFDFVAKSITEAADLSYTSLNLILPLGISFYTFQQLSFVVQCYKGNKGDVKFFEYVLYVTFFPQLIAGPIVFLSEFLPSLRKRCWRNYVDENVVSGIFLFCLGLFKKLVLADTFSIFADTAFNSSSEVINSSSAWIGAVSYYFQLYFDFSGYCDMAIGAALLFNIKLPLNFNAPYKARNIQDFWRRWHITLSRWLRDYLYIPLGGNRENNLLTMQNVIIVFIIGGIWHGANWTFIVWGLIHGIAIVIFLLWSKIPLNLPKIFSWSLTQIFVLVAWVVFRSKDLEFAGDYLTTMFGFFGFLDAQDIFNQVSGSYLSLFSSELKVSSMNAPVLFYFIFFVFGSWLIVLKGSNYSSIIVNEEHIGSIKKGVLSGICISLIIIMKPVLHESPFIYFNF